MSEVLRVVRAAATNLLAGLAPRAYLRMTGQTGRGARDLESPGDIAAYFEASLADYLRRLGLRMDDAGAFLEDKVVVEYGPGDFPGVAILLVAYGARKVYCVDRFPMVTFGDKNLQVLQTLIARLPDTAKRRAVDLFVDPGVPQRGLRETKVEYLVTPHGFSHLHEAADLVLSRAVLEHVDDLEGTFADMKRAMRPKSTSLHLVDLRSHGLHRANPLDFLEWDPWLWRVMYSNKGVPNRWRVNHYRDLVRGLGVRGLEIDPVALADDADVAAVRDRLAKPFREIDTVDLACLAFWLRFDKPPT